MPRPSFYKLILPKVIHERRLRIPDNFVKKFGNDLTGVVRLGLPDGLVWRIGLIKADNKFWLHDGWQKFTERYTLNVGCLVIFRYEGNAVFNVNIFNLSASEINYQSSALIGKRYLAFEDVEDDDCMENWDSSTCVASDQPTATKTYHHHPPAMQNLLSDSKLNYINWGDGNHPLSKSGAISQVPDQFSRDIDVQYSATKYNSNLNEVEFYSPAGETQKTKKRGRKKLKVESNDEQKAAQDEDEDEADMRFRLYQSASARKRTVTAEERERAVNAAKAFEPSNPFCRVVLRPSYLYKGCIMHLPSTFVEQHLSGVSGFIKLQFFDGKQWPVRCRYRGGRAKLSQGWYEFAQENHLGEGDVCVFELLKSRDIVLKVTVFPVHENPGFMTLNRPAR